MEPKEILLPFCLTYRHSDDFLAAAPGSWEHTLLRARMKDREAQRAAESLVGYYWYVRDASDPGNPSTPVGPFPDVWACRASALVRLRESWYDFPDTVPPPEVLVLVQAGADLVLTAKCTRNRKGEISWDSGLVYPNGHTIYIQGVTKWRWL